MLVVFENGIQVNVETSVAMQMLALAFGSNVKPASVETPTPVASTPVASTPVVAEQPKAYKASRNITEAGFDFEVVAENGGIVAKGVGGKYLPNTLRKVCNYHIKSAGFKWDGTDKCYKGGDSSKIDTHITQEEYNRYADKVDARNARKYGA